MSNENKFQDQRFLRPIRQLDRVLINKIAAGEVIERPASVIKELVENSCDAGATSVDIIAQKSGTTLISVVDNGCGIPPDQVRLAFSRHATSKIQSLDDLFAVNSYGFRGEALPSIASVSHLALTTRYFAEQEGTYIAFEGGKQTDFRPVSAPVGTKIEVSHLFFNTPARRKFLKSEIAESRQIIRVVERMALGKPSVAFSLTLNDRVAFRLPADQPIAQRMATLFGAEQKDIVEYDIELSGVSYLVYLTHPDQARNDRTRICLFINGRSVASSTIIHAVTGGYGEFLPPGRYPLAAIFITVDPQLLDVNVHPTKAEVRLSEERAIHDNLFRIVNKALRDWRLSPMPHGQRTSFPSGGGQTLNITAPRQPEMPWRPPSFFSGGNTTRPSDLGQTYSTGANDPAACDNSRPVVDDPVSHPVDMGGLDPAAIIFLTAVDRLYLVMLVHGELYIVDQHAAHERILYEEALTQVDKGGATGQNLLFPETVDLSAEEYLTFETSNDLLTKLGFDISPFGQQAVIVNTVPTTLGSKNPGLILRRMLDDITQLNKAGGDLVKSIAQSMACRAAVMAGDHMSGEEAKNLVLRLLTMNNPFCCPHGRPTFIKVTREELDDRFGRT
jgi:DNA mismatch repair protein MutL